MADEEIDDEQDDGKGKGNKFPVILIAVLVLVGLVLAGGISYFITTQVVSSSSDAGAVPVNHDPGVFVKLGDAKEGIIVNVGGVKSSRFLKVSIILELNPGKSDVLVDGKVTEVADAKIMDTTLQILRTIKLEELDANKQEDLKDKMKQEINKAVGEGSVYDVYITSFMLQ